MRAVCICNIFLRMFLSASDPCSNFCLWPILYFLLYCNRFGVRKIRRFWRMPPWWCAPESVVYVGSFHILQEMVYTSHLLIFSRPKPGGGVYIMVSPPFARLVPCYGRPPAEPQRATTSSGACVSHSHIESAFLKIRKGYVFITYMCMLNIRKQHRQIFKNLGMFGVSFSGECVLCFQPDGRPFHIKQHLVRALIQSIVLLYVSSHVMLWKASVFSY